MASNDDLGSLLGIDPVGGEAPMLAPSDLDLITRAAVAEGDQNDPDSWRNVAGVVLNRMKATGRTAAEILAEPSQFEAYGNGSIQKVDPKSPAYQAAQKAIQPVIAGDVNVPYDSFYSPGIVAARGHGTPPFDPSTGTKIGTQLFGNGYSPAPDADLGSILGVPTSTAPAQPNSDAAAEAAYQKVFGIPASSPTPAEQAANMTPAQRAAAAQTIVNAEAEGAQSGKAQWPVYDPTNKVGRNEDGSIAYVGEPNTVSPDGTINVNASAHPQAIASYLKANPLDPANHVAARDVQAAAQSDADILTGDQPDAFDKASLGVGQGLANVSNSINNFSTAIRTNPAGNAFLSGLTGQYVPSDVARAESAANLLNRNTNDVNNANSTSYQLGKFGGEVAGTLPVMAATGGVGGALGDAALGGTRFAPVADFLGGQTAGRLVGARGASLAANGMLQGGEASALTSAGSSEPLSHQIEQGAVGGGILGPGVPVVTGALGAGFNRLIAPKLSQNVAELADKAINDYGIPINKFQVLGASGDRRAATKASGMISEPASGFAQNHADQLQAMTKAVVNSFGGDADGVAVPEISPAVMQGAKRRIGDVFQDVGKRTNITDTNALQSRLGAISEDIAQTPLGDNGQAALQAQIANIGSAIKQGVLSGEDYLTLTRKGTPLDRAMNAKDPNTAHIAGQIHDALTDALQAAAAPEDLAALKKARFQYKNLMTIARIANKADVEGNVPLGLIAGAVNQNFKNSAFQGAGPLGDLSQIYRTFIKEPPQSGTVPRLLDVLKRNAGPLALSGGAGTANLFMHDPGLALKLGGAAALATGAKYGGNMLSGALNGSRAGAALVRRAVAPQTPNAFLTQASLQVMRSALNDNYIPATVIGGNQFLRSQGQ